MEQEKQLTRRQAAFVREFLTDRNATQAALRAGYSTKAAGQVGHDLLKKTEIQDAIDREESALAAASKVNREKTVRDLVALYDVDLRSIAKVVIHNCKDCWKGLDQPADHPDNECPTCKGVGVAVLVIADFTKLTRHEAAMVKSVKMGKHGPEVSFHDRLAIVDRIVKLCGLEPKRAGADEQNPLHLLLQQMQGSALPVQASASTQPARALSRRFADY
jgi:phage terminase small subunit